jgi:hypothetical protein
MGARWRRRTAGVRAIEMALLLERTDEDIDAAHRTEHKEVFSRSLAARVNSGLLDERPCFEDDLRPNADGDPVWLNDYQG